MADIKLKNMLGRPRVFTVVNHEGKCDSIHFKGKESLNIDDSLLTQEIISNIQQGYLHLVEGVIPEEQPKKPIKKKGGVN